MRFFFVDFGFRNVVKEIRGRVCSGDRKRRCVGDKETMQLEMGEELMKRLFDVNLEDKYRKTDGRRNRERRGKMTVGKEGVVSLFDSSMVPED